MRPTRRHLLRGAAWSLALPLLPSLVPREARAAAASPPRRLVVWFSPNGMLPRSSKPAAAGPLAELPDGIAPLQPLIPRCTVLTELRNVATDAARAGCDHSRGLGTLLNDRDVDITARTYDAAITFDQVAANALAGATPFPSMQLGCEGQVGSFCSIASNDCTYQGTLSWASPTLPLPPIVSPRAVYDLMFGGADSGASVREARARKELRFSVLDRVLDRTADLSAKASAADREKLDQYLTGVRDLELRLEALEAISCPEPERPLGQMPLPELHQVFRQLTTIALQCDYTRIITFLAGRSASDLVYDHLELSQRTTHHLISHHLNDPVWMRDLTTIQAWLVEQYVALAQDLAAVPDGEGDDLLKNTALVLVSEFGDPLEHDYGDLTWVVAGGEAHGWVHGQHRPQGYRPHADVFLNLLDFVGVPMDSFGENGRTPVALS